MHLAEGHNNENYIEIELNQTAAELIKLSKNNKGNLSMQNRTHSVIITTAAAAVTGGGGAAAAELTWNVRKQL